MNEKQYWGTRGRGRRGGGGGKGAVWRIMVLLCYWERFKVAGGIKIKDRGD